MKLFPPEYKEEVANKNKNENENKKVYNVCIIIRLCECVVLSNFIYVKTEVPSVVVASA